MSPGLMPRPSLSAGKSRAQHAGTVVVSPGLMPRPSLSAVRPWDARVARPRVAGVDAPAFVERSGSDIRSLSRGPVSPGLMPRPSLSDCKRGGRCESGRRVAGVDAPAFVERLPSRTCQIKPLCVAGVDAPAFVERLTLTT